MYQVFTGKKQTKTIKARCVRRWCLYRPSLELRDGNNKPGVCPENLVPASLLQHRIFWFRGFLFIFYIIFFTVITEILREIKALLMEVAIKAENKIVLGRSLNATCWC